MNVECCKLLVKGDVTLKPGFIVKLASASSKRQYAHRAKASCRAETAIQEIGTALSMRFDREPIVQTAPQACRTDRILDIRTRSGAIENARQTRFDRKIHEAFPQEFRRCVEGQARFDRTAGCVAHDDP